MAPKPAAVISPAGPSSVVTQPWDNPYGKGVQVSSRHYRIYTTATSQGVTEFLPSFMESSFVNYCKLTGVTDGGDSQPGEIYMMADRKQWAQLTQNLVREQPESYLSIQAGGYCYRGTCVFWDIGFMHTLPVAAHEGLHQYLVTHLKDTLPMAIEEGLCVMAEGFNLDEKDRVTFVPEDPWMHRGDLRLATEGHHWLPLRRLLSMDAGDAIAGTNDEAVSYYAQLYALLLYIRTHQPYRQGLENMIADAQAGNVRQTLSVNVVEYLLLKNDPRKYNRRLSEPMFRKYISDDLDTFDRDYTQFSQQLFRGNTAPQRQVAAAAK